MRTLVDIPDNAIARLNALSEREQRSRASMVREAIVEYLARRTATGDVDAFGLWGKHKQDGLAYQKKVRAEW